MAPPPPPPGYYYCYQQPQQPQQQDQEIFMGPPPFMPPPSLMSCPPAPTIEIPSICIPRVMFKYGKEYIENVFINTFGRTIFNEPCVDNVDMVLREDMRTGEPYHIVFVHFKKTTMITPELQEIVKKLHAGQEVTIMCEYPWFWKIRKNTATKHTFANSQKRILSEEDVKDIREYQKTMRLEQETLRDEDEYDEYSCSEYDDDEIEMEYECMRMEERMANDPLYKPATINWNGPSKIGSWNEPNVVDEDDANEKVPSEFEELIEYDENFPSLPHDTKNKKLFKAMFAHEIEKEIEDEEEQGTDEE